jgi:hexosaminidase
MQKSILIILILMLTSTLSAAPASAPDAVDASIAIIPLPVKCSVAAGHFAVTSATVIWVDSAQAKLGRQLAGMLAPATGFSLRVESAGQPPVGDVIRIDITPADKTLGDEGYRLQATGSQVLITAGTDAGAFYGLQTLRQLLPPQVFAATQVDNVPWGIPAVTIEDKPRFRYRGLMLDCSRHFMPKEFVLRFIDLLAIHKMNVFHWHLTDDQGWRLEIKKYPRLTEIGAWRKETLVGHYGEHPPRYDGIRHGGFYTQDDVREVVAYAADRHVMVIPEIEMPGHSRAAIAAYPQLGNVTEPLEVKTTWGVEPHILNVDESTIQFYQNVLAEVLELFPSPYIHIGGDEAVKTEWDASPKIKARMAELGVKNSHDLQSWFITRMDQYLTAHGRRLIGWDEILEGGLSPNAVVMSWHGDKGAIEAAQQGHDAVMTPTHSTYFDYCQSKDKAHEPLSIGGFLPLSMVYAFNPMPKELTAAEQPHLLGGQGQIWTEYIQNPKQAEYMTYPRACALAEDLWTPNESKDYGNFIDRLRTHLIRLKAMDVNYRQPEEIAK